MRWFMMLLVIVLLTGCGTPNYTSGTFEGYYTVDTKTLSFTPCENANGEEYWVEVEDSAFDKRLKTLFISAPSEVFIVYVRFEGELSPLKTPNPTYPNKSSGYGNLGQYEREVVVTKLLEMEMPNQQCYYRK